MAKLSRDLGSGNLHPREAIYGTATLGSLNAETVINCDGCYTVAVDLRGTFNLTVEIAGTIDGTNWIPIPVRPLNVAAKIYVATVAGSTAGVWVGNCSFFRQVRARVTAYTSGAATTYLIANTAPFDNALEGQITTSTGTTIGSAGSATTLTLTAPGAGLRHYLTYLSINRFNASASALTASTTPIAVTTTNLPGSLAFTFAADALAAGALDRWREDFAYAIAASAQNTATTIVCPATTSTIWRVTAGFYVAP